MKHLRGTFTDQEWEVLKKTKDKSKLNWHDFIMILAKIKWFEEPVLRNGFSSADGDVCEQMEGWRKKGVVFREAKIEK